MADVLLIRSSRGFRIFFPSCCRMWGNARHLRTVTGVFGQPVVKLKPKETLFRISETSCPSCLKLNRLLSQADVVLSSQVDTTERSPSWIWAQDLNKILFCQGPAVQKLINTNPTELEKPKKYQPLHVMPFSVIQGGKYVAHVLLKHRPKTAIVFVRTKVLAVELRKELVEYGLKCSSPEGAYNMESTETEEKDEQGTNTKEVDTEQIESEQRITVMTEGEVGAMESLLPVDLILLVQQPMTGKSFTLFCLKKTHAKVHPLDVVLLYSHNDLAFLNQMQTHVDIKKLSPPSFHNVSMVTEGLPSLPGESVVTPARDLIEPPPPAITATIPPKHPRSKLFHPPVPVPVKQSERHRLTDRVRIYIRGGTGGQGSSYFGGMGGDGGDVVVQSVPNASLGHFSLKENRRILAEHGTFFSGKPGKKQRGLRARDTVIPVPVGTTVSTDDGQILAELDEVGSRVLVARGGRGGSPATENWCGEKGERLMIRLEMRLIADLALVGFPNAGKSSLLRAITKATPKAADYAFTTMRPSIGIVEYSDHSQVSVADLPGLIEGASANRGLGHSFLKHTQKARALALVVDIDGFHLSDKFPVRTALQNVFILLKELVLYDRELLNRPKVLVITKLDKKGATSRCQELQQKLDSIQQHGTLLSILEGIRSNSPVVQENTDLMDLADELTRTRFDSVIPVSAVTSFGLEDLRENIKALIEV